MRKWTCLLNSIKEKEIILTDIYSKVNYVENIKEGKWERECYPVNTPKVFLFNSRKQQCSKTRPKVFVQSLKEINFT